MFTSIQRRLESRGAFGLIFWSREGLDEGFFMIPRKPGREFDDFLLDLGSVEVVEVVVSIPDISWMGDAFPLVLEVVFPIYAWN
jgi:hypothetical protein